MNRDSRKTDRGDRRSNVRPKKARSRSPRPGPKHIQPKSAPGRVRAGTSH